MKAALLTPPAGSGLGQAVTAAGCTGGACSLLKGISQHPTHALAQMHEYGGRRKEEKTNPCFAELSICANFLPRGLAQKRNSLPHSGLKCKS